MVFPPAHCKTEVGYLLFAKRKNLLSFVYLIAQFDFLSQHSFSLLLCNVATSKIFRSNFFKFIFCVVSDRVYARASR